MEVNFEAHCYRNAFFKKRPLPSSAFSLSALRFPPLFARSRTRILFSNSFKVTTSPVDVSVRPFSTTNYEGSGNRTDREPYEVLLQPETSTIY